VRASTFTVPKKSFEWTQIEIEDQVIHAGEIPSRVKVPDYAHLLPKEIAGFTTGGVYDFGQQSTFVVYQGAGHGGSHPHLAHEFLTA